MKGPGFRQSDRVRRPQPVAPDELLLRTMASSENPERSASASESATELRAALLRIALSPKVDRD